MRYLGQAAAAFLLSLAIPFASGQATPSGFGGSFQHLQPAQQALIKRWIEEYRVVYNRQLDVETVYNRLPLSARTTFEAITHALMHSNLTSKDGKPMGTALDNIDMIERISGQIPKARGDRQFRAYAYLKPGAMNKLHAAREFKRVHDNTVYHIGYPVISASKAACLQSKSRSPGPAGAPTSTWTIVLQQPSKFSSAGTSHRRIRTFAPAITPRSITAAGTGSRFGGGSC
jgi:hypothetical protein